MNTDQLYQFSINFRYCVEQIQSISNPYPQLICDSLSRACQDCQVEDGNADAGPYDNSTDFNQLLMDLCGLIPGPAQRVVIADVHSH
ncbi:hypothetical protein ACJ72_01032 [Emergomyces africanus]|uniref:Uncharacterized protein n=1 Tax=Emergomyces africanus TaxID=1955775 RepID=A0A1B7P6E5_9EURO|nr:hypothetical protein ACJ72_01032 [Emergomyces africanus]